MKPLSIEVTCYSQFGCPKCGAKHKYGHTREYQTCYRCWHDFSPQNARLYEEDRIHDHPPYDKLIVRPAPTLKWWEKIKKLITK